MEKQKNVLEIRGYLTLESFLNEDIFSLGFLQKDIINEKHTYQKELMDEAMKIALVIEKKYHYNIWNKVLYVFDKWTEIRAIAANFFFNELCSFFNNLGINSDIIENDELFNEELNHIFNNNYKNINVRNYVSNYTSEYIIGIFAEIEQSEDPADYVKLSWDNEKSNIIFTLNCNKFKNSFIKKYIFSLMKQNLKISQDDIYSFRFDLSAKENECFIYINENQYSYKHIGVQAIEQFKERFARLFLRLSHFTVYEFQQRVLGDNFKNLNYQEIVEWKRLGRISQMEQIW